MKTICRQSLMNVRSMDANFPKYLLKVGEKLRYCSLNEAGRVYDCGMIHVEIRGEVLESDFTVREITEVERLMIADIAEEYSASK